MSVKRAQREIDSAEFTEWMAYHNIEPFSLKVTDHVLASIATILANVHKRPGGKPFKPEDFLPQTQKRKIEDPKDMEIKLRAMFPK